MNSVALPASSSKSVLGAEAELVRHAARGDAGALDELFRLHSAPAWRLAQAVAPDTDSAADAFADGFARAVRGFRLPRRAGNDPAAFRPRVMAAVYRAAADHAYDRSAAVPRGHRPDTAELALADAAFRSLPERWRAAIWLSEVENLDAHRLSEVLGVSVPVAEQLTVRARRGLTGRFTQARQTVPEHFGEILRAVALPVPSRLLDDTTRRWESTGAERTAVVAPAVSWLENRGVRPMAVAAGALIGVGLIGLGVVPGAGSLHSALGGAGTAGLNGSIPVRACIGLDCPNPTNANLGGLGTASLTGTLGGAPGSLAASGADAGFSGTGGTGGSAGSGTGGSTGSGYTGGGYIGGGSIGSGPIGSGPSGGGGLQLPGTGTTVPPPPSTGSGSTLLNVPGAATITSSGGTTNVALAPSSSGSLATVTVGCNSLLQVCTTSGTGSTSTAAPTTTTTTPTTSVVSGTLSATTGTLSGATSTSTTTLPGGL